MVLVWIVLIFVYAHHHRYVFLLGGSGDDHLLAPSIDVQLGLVPAAENARRLDDKFNLKLPQGNSEGLRSAMTLMGRPSTTILSPSAFHPRPQGSHGPNRISTNGLMSWHRLDRLRQRSQSPDPQGLPRNTLRPIRPNPLIPTRMLIIFPPCMVFACPPRSGTASRERPFIGYADMLILASKHSQRGLRLALSSADGDDFANGLKVFEPQPSAAR